MESMLPDPTNKTSSSEAPPPHHPTAHAVACAAALNNSNSNSMGVLTPWQRSKHETAGLVLRALALVMVAAAGWIIWSVWVPLVLASWGAILARPLHRRLSRYVGGRERAAGVVSVSLVLLLCAPVVLIGLSLTSSAYNLVNQLGASAGVGGAIDTLLSTDGATQAVAQGDPRRIAEMLRSKGSGAFDVATTAFGAATHISVQLLVFVVAFYTFMVDGPRAYNWFATYAPIPRRHFDRLAGAFAETGRGLVVSFGLTALAQGVVAGLGFLIAGVPKALALGALTGIASFVPMVGTGLVTVPVALAMFLARDTTAGVICAATFMLAGAVDNPMRAMLSRFAQLHLPSFVVFISLLGGVLVFGPSGIIAGPLLARLSVETLRLWKEGRLADTGMPPTPVPTADIAIAHGPRPDHV